MAKLFSVQYGIGGICVLLTIMVLLEVGKFLWAIQAKKASLSEQAVLDLTKAVQANTVATQFLEQRLQHLEISMSELPKLKLDLRRFYTAIKTIAGDKWPNIRDEIMKDGEFPV